MQVSPPAVKLQYTLKESPKQPWLGSIQYSPKTKEKIFALYSRNGIQKDQALLLPNDPPKFVGRLFYLNGLGQGAKFGAICTLICTQRCLHGAWCGCSWHKHPKLPLRGIHLKQRPFYSWVMQLQHQWGLGMERAAPHPRSIHSQCFLKSAILIRMMISMRVLIFRCFTNRTANYFMKTNLIQFQTNSGGFKEKWQIPSPVLSSEYRA